MNTTILTDILKKYEQKRLQAEKDFEQRKEKLYLANPRLQEIDDELSKLGISTAKAMLFNNSAEALNSLNTQVELLKNEKLKILEKNNLTADYLTPHYSCNLCNDTGYVTTDFKTTICNCLKQEIYNVEYNKSNLSHLETENFEHFSLDVYSDTPNKEKYNSDISPKENMKIIKKLCDKFIENSIIQKKKIFYLLETLDLGKHFYLVALQKK